MEWRQLGGSELKVPVLTLGSGTSMEFTPTRERFARRDAASEVPLVYPYWHQRQCAERNPSPV